MTAPVIPVIIRTHLKAPGTSKNDIGKFMPNIPATTPKIATTNVAVVSSSSNCISWFRTLSWSSKNQILQCKCNMQIILRLEMINKDFLPLCKPILQYLLFCVVRKILNCCHTIHLKNYRDGLFSTSSISIYIKVYRIIQNQRSIHIHST